MHREAPKTSLSGDSTQNILQSGENVTIDGKYCGEKNLTPFQTPVLCNTSSQCLSWAQVCVCGCVCVCVCVRLLPFATLHLNASAGHRCVCVCVCVCVRL